MLCSNSRIQYRICISSLIAPPWLETTDNQEESQVLQLAKPRLGIFLPFSRATNLAVFIVLLELSLGDDKG